MSYAAGHLILCINPFRRESERAGHRRPGKPDFPLCWPYPQVTPKLGRHPPPQPLLYQPRRRVPIQSPGQKLEFLRDGGRKKKLAESENGGYTGGGRLLFLLPPNSLCNPTSPTRVHCRSPRGADFPRERPDSSSALAPGRARKRSRGGGVAVGWGFPGLWGAPCHLPAHPSVGAGATRNPSRDVFPSLKIPWLFRI